MRAKDLAVLLQIPAGKREELHKILDALLEEGKIGVNKRGKYEAIRKTSKSKEKNLQKHQKPAKKEHIMKELLSAIREDLDFWNWMRRRVRIFLSRKRALDRRFMGTEYRLS